MMDDVAYISTRGNSPTLDFEGAILTGLARDGGLYVPDKWPEFARKDIAELAGRSYEDIAAFIMKPFVGSSFGDSELCSMIEEAYAVFGHSARCPLVQIEQNLFLLELHHGPTLAFKDFALQLVSRMLDSILKKRNRRATIVGATSGDTGSAAIEAFRGLESVDVFILFPDGRVSDIQRRQMTTPDDENVYALAINGDFDDCQSLVKSMFNDLDFRDRFNLAAVNSINWARVVAQIVYYYAAASALGSPDREMSFVVPTGNFGDVYAGYAARRTGLPVRDLLVSTNQNDILYRAMNSGKYETREVAKSISPSMDIQVSSNFERALFEAHGRNPAAVCQDMQELAKGGFAIEEEPLSFLRSEFGVDRCSETETYAEITNTFRRSGQIVCPHTAVGIKAARKLTPRRKNPVVALATAHAAKFPEAVNKACGIQPELPDRMSGIHSMPERHTRLECDLGEVQSFINRNSIR